MEWSWFSSILSAQRERLVGHLGVTRWHRRRTVHGCGISHMQVTRRNRQTAAWRHYWFPGWARFCGCSSLSMSNPHLVMSTLWRCRLLSSTPYIRIIVVYGCESRSYGARSIRQKTGEHCRPRSFIARQWSQIWHIARMNVAIGFTKYMPQVSHSSDLSCGMLWSKTGDIIAAFPYLDIDGCWSGISALGTALSEFLWQRRTVLYTVLLLHQCCRFPAISIPRH